MQISELGEKKLITRLLNKRDDALYHSDKNLIESYHDDAALQENKNKYTVLSTDMLIQHTHFPKQMSYFQMGQKIVTVNVSDILAMNAKPISILISMGLPTTMLLTEFDELVEGILYNCKQYNITLIGGDLNESNEVILSAATTGYVNEDYKLQTNIQEDDLIAVTGELGLAAAGFDLLSSDCINMLIEDKEKIINSILEPKLPINTAYFFRNHPEIITSMTDITDGLAVELGHLHEKNKNLGFEIYFDKIPYDKNIEVIAKHNHKSVNDYLLHFGEEFELLVTINKKKYEQYKYKIDNLHIIGKVNNSNKITIIKDNSVNKIKTTGYEHLKKR